MNALVYLLWRQFVNMLKELKKRPVLLIVYILFIALMAFSFTISYNELGAEDARFASYYPIAVAAVSMFIFWGALRRGEKEGSGFFSMADVHLLFPSPISPSTILGYGTLGQMSSLLLICVLMLFQITTLRMFFGLTFGGMMGLITSLALLLFSTQILSMLYYAFLSVKPARRALCQKITMGLLLALAALVAFFYFQEREILPALNALIDVIAYIPLAGWFVRATFSAAQDNWTIFALFSALQVAVGAVMLILLIRIQPDYYEDVLGMAQKRQTMVEVKKSGVAQQNAVLRNLGKFPFIGKGAFAIFGRHLISYARQGFFDAQTIAILVIGILWPLMNGTMFGDLDSTFRADERMTVAFLAYLMIFFNMQGMWAQEMKKPFIFLIPDSPGRKMVAATLLGVFKCFVDGLLAGIAATIILSSSWLHLPLFALAVASFAAVYTAADILARRLLGETHSKGLGVFVTFAVMIGCAIPAAILLMVLPPLIGYAVCIGLNLGISLAILLLCDGLFSRIGFETGA